MKCKLLFGLLLLLVVGCQKPLWQSKEVKGFRSYNKGEFWYKWYGKTAEAPKAKEGEQIQMDYAILKGKKILQTSFGSKRPVFVHIPEKKYDNFFTKALKLMAEGDSLHIKIKANTIPDLLHNFASEFAEDDWVDFYYKCYKIKDKKSLAQEIKAQQAKIDSTHKEVSKLVTAFTQNQEIPELSATPTGLQYIKYNTNNNPKATKNDLVAIHYICYNQKGIIVDESYVDMIPLEFNIGTTAVIDGLSEGVSLIGEKESVFLAIPSSLAYGDKGSGILIAPNTTIFFYIELITIN